MFTLVLAALFAVVSADFSLECKRGFRVSAIKRAPTYYGKGLGSLSIECEEVAHSQGTLCLSQPTIPRCSGELEGCSGSQWLGGIHAFEVENSTKALLIDPICCSSPEVRVAPDSCIHDLLNKPEEQFDHSIVSDLVYRGMQCWHQVDKNGTLVDLVWKVETCVFESETFPPILMEPHCEECDCECGPIQCENGERPIRVVHKTRIPPCDCDCSCVYKCL